MPKPKNKAEFLNLSQKNYQKLINFIDNLPTEKQNQDFPAGTMNRNIRDVLGHLYHWHLMFLNWYEVGMKGEKPKIPADGYTWKMTTELNQMILEKYQNMDLETATIKLEETHLQITEIIEQHTDTELFTKQYYKWTNITSLGAYLISTSSSHYDWAWKLIKKCT
jgi:hypothetical protein